MNSWAFAMIAASSTSCWDASIDPIAILSLAEFENKKLSLGVSRRAYSFGLVYDQDHKSIAADFNVFNFGYNKNASKF